MKFPRQTAKPSSYALFFLSLVGSDTGATLTVQAGISAGGDSRTPFFHNVLACCRSCGHSNKNFLYTFLCEDRIDVLSEIWDHYFTETLPTLQAIFYPVQGQELTIRQIALLGFRDLVLLKVKLEEVLPLVQTKLPASIVQMLLILQSVHEPTGPSEGYLQLEELVKQVVSPYLGLCEDHSFSGSTCLLERRYSRSRPKTGGLNYSSHVVTSRQPSEMALTPLTEQEGEAYLEKCGSIRRHTVANAHSDIQLLAMASMMHTGMVIEESDSTDKCLLLQPSFSHRQCSSEPSIADGPEGVMAAGRQDPAELNCTSVS
ncbi:proline-rich protein 5-like isoform X2 [Harpia harpyja]|uniref:proline-rich protein 5-like isoform X2 n=1 Tax=Harpia harpyja TaxID=202280 RepID=UPI0022B0FA5F|nr:proline-rich protein 5-like isoform X2 [Harpia harpyja]